MRAIAAFPANEDGDLELAEGDLIEILEHVDDAWLMGKKENGQVGIFPSNFAESVDDQYVATFDYSSDVESDLQFAAGESITITSKGQ